MQVYKTVKSQALEEVEGDDLVGLTAAAKLGNYTISGIMRLIQRDALPEYRLSQLEEDDRVFTSKRALLALPARKRKAKPAGKAKKAQ